MPHFRITDALNQRRPVFGTFLKINSPTLVELIGLAGFDFIIIDAEHGCFTSQDVENLIRAAELHGMSTIVRTPDDSASAILHALDAGAAGVQIPGLQRAASARDVVQRARHFPDGQRGFARANRAADFGGMPLNDYFARTRGTLVSIHVECREMLEEVDELARTPGVDILFAGTADLSQSLGHPGQIQHPEVQAGFDRIVDAALAAGRHAGAVAGSSDELEKLLDRGVTYIVWQSDIGIIRNALGQAADIFARHR